MILKTERYERDKFGARWKHVDTQITEDYSVKLWDERIIDSIPFFESLGGTEITEGFTQTSVRPDGLVKTVRNLERKEG